MGSSRGRRAKWARVSATASFANPSLPPAQSIEPDGLRIRRQRCLVLVGTEPEDPVEVVAVSARSTRHCGSSRAGGPARSIRVGTIVVFTCADR